MNKSPNKSAIGTFVILLMPYSIACMLLDMYYNSTMVIPENIARASAITWIVGIIIILGISLYVRNRVAKRMYYN